MQSRPAGVNRFGAISLEECAAFEGVEDEASHDDHVRLLDTAKSYVLDMAEKTRWGVYFVGSL
jgi:hypothetical protein